MEAIKIERKNINNSCLHSFVHVSAQLKPEVFIKEARHRLALREGQKENGEKIMKLSKTFKRIAIFCELAAFISVILGLIISGFNYDPNVFYAVAFGLAIFPVLCLAREVGYSLSRSWGK